MALESLDRGLAVLEYIATNGAASVSEVAAAFQVNKSTASRILAALSDRNLLRKDEQTMKYYPDVGTLLLSCRTLREYRIPDLVHPHLRELSRQLDFTSQLCVLRRGQAYILDQVKGSRTRYLREPALPGMTEPLYCSAIGKCILAYQPPERIRQLIGSAHLVAYTENTVTDPVLLERELAQIRDSGCAWDRGELSLKVWCLAVPVFSPDGSVRLSVGISGGRDLHDDPQLRANALAALRSTAGIIEKEYISNLLSETGGDHS